MNNDIELGIVIKTMQDDINELKHAVSDIYKLFEQINKDEPDNKPKSDL